MEAGHSQELALYCLLQPAWQHGSPILAPFPSPYVDQACLRVQIFDPERHALGDTEPRAVEQVGHQAGNSVHLGQHGGHLFHGQDDGQPVPSLDTPEAA